MAVKDKLIGLQELAMIVGVVLVAVGFGLIYYPLSLIWLGAVVMGTVYYTLPKSTPEDE